jgi:hypothetical protein
MLIRQDLVYRSSGSLVDFTYQPSEFQRYVLCALKVVGEPLAFINGNPSYANRASVCRTLHRLLPIRSLRQKIAYP